MARIPTVLGAWLPCVLWLSSCASVDKFTWVDSLPPAQVGSANDYVVAPGDVLSISVWNQEKMSAKVKVRQDGRITLPFLNDVDTTGKRPNELGKELEVKLKEFILNPMVTVVTEETKPLNISVLGEVARPGQYTMESGAGLLQAFAAAGGLTDFANRERLFVLRERPSSRVRFTYDSLIRRNGSAAEFRLMNGDVIVAE
jgi:polysaccharide export outer membrane protein